MEKFNVRTKESLRKEMNVTFHEEFVEKNDKKYQRVTFGTSLPYFALLKNLRNIVQTNDKALIDMACIALVDEKAIRKSLVLPFRFVTAYEELEKAAAPGKMLAAVTDALDIACANVPKFDGETLVVLDESGSMGGKPIQIGSLFAAILAKSNAADLILFSDQARYKSVNPRSTVRDIVHEIQRDLRMAGTDLASAFKIMNKKYDRIIILSDMQTWMESVHGYHGYGSGGSSQKPSELYAQYSKKYGNKPFVYSFDLQGQGSVQFNPADRKHILLAGFSEKVLELMKYCEQDPDALINKIKAVSF